MPNVPKLAMISAFAAMGLPLAALAATPTVWTTDYSAAYYGSTGQIRFNDWGYVGPNGANAGSFAVTSPVTGITGFDSSRIGQQQNVLTLNPDWQTPDPNITATMNEPTMTPRYNASQDGQVNFYQWTYTTVGGSTFNNMTIDKAGNYFVAKNDMSFRFYDYFYYHDETGANADRTFDTRINFQPYAVSDARGWCGSTLVTNPNGLDIMAGQVTFDFAFDAYLSDANASSSGGATQIVPDFVMRSYGSYEVTVDIAPGESTYYTGSAVMNNNNPEGNPLNANGEVTENALDANWQNRVSFLGAGIVPKGVWVTPDSYTSPGVKRLNADGTWNLTVAGEGIASLCDPANAGAAPVPDAVCYGNSFGGYGFLMRADGQRTLTYLGENGHSDYVTTDAAAYTSIGQTPPGVPLPGAAWLLGSGIVALGAAVRRTRGAAR